MRDFVLNDYIKNGKIDVDKVILFVRLLKEKIEFELKEHPEDKYYLDWIDKLAGSRLVE